MIKPLLEHEKKELIRDYLVTVANQPNWDITKFSIDSISKKTKLKEKEILDLISDLQRDKDVLFRHFNFDAYIPNTENHTKKLNKFEKDKNLVSYFNVYSLVFTSIGSTIIIFLLIKTYWPTFISNAIKNDNDTVSLFVKGSIIGLAVVFLTIIIIKKAFDWYLTRLKHSKKLKVLVTIISALLIISVFAYWQFNIVVSIISILGTIIYVVSDMYNTFKEDINLFLENKKRRRRT